MMSTLRSRVLLDLAHEMQTCQVRVPGVCKGVVPAGLEPAHPNWQWANRGVGHKADDVFAAACHDCAVWIDYSGNPREEREYYWLRGAIRTWSYLMRNDWLSISSRRLVNGGMR